MRLLTPKPSTEFGILNGRLALFRSGDVGSDYWRSYWHRPEHLRTMLAAGQAGNLGFIEPAVEAYVPRDLPVVDAGCGPGRFVAALNARGYNVSGIDADKEVVAFVNDNAPELDVGIGNIFELEAADGSLGCYLSMGVLEHFPEGMAPAVREIQRVLHPRGYALISVPHLNPLRRAYRDELLGQDESLEGPNSEFFQYYFSEKEFVDTLGDHGLEVVDTVYQGAEGFLPNEHPAFGPFWRSKLCRYRMQRVMRKALQRGPQALHRRYGHMVLYVARLAR